MRSINRAIVASLGSDDHLAAAAICPGGSERSESTSDFGRGDTPLNQVLPAEVRLHILHHAKMAPIHCTWMAGTLARRGYRVSPAMLHTVMYHMQGEFLLMPDRQRVDGRLRRVYDITAHGIWALEEPEFVAGLGGIKIDR